MLSTLNYETDFSEPVKDWRIGVQLADVEQLSLRAVHLDEGKHFKVDLLCRATGWKRDLKMNFPPESASEKVELPTFSSEQDVITTKPDTEILQPFPKLQSQPHLIRFSENNNSKSPNRSLCLFHLLIPLTYLIKCNIGFCGIIA